VTTPTQTGSGERSHLLSESITLSLFIDDIVNHLTWEDLTSVVLVGHSFGGITITGVADAVPERIAKLIYLDGAILENGEALFDLFPKEIIEARIQAANETSGGLTMAAPPAEHFGLSDPDDVAFVEGRLTPHPLATLKNVLTINSPAGNGLPTNYIMCVDPVYEVVRVFHQRAREAGWPISEIAAGHDAMVSKPVATADLFEKHSA
jgi:pimeloyl-ACP methyl ester carboxylesterase